MSTELYTRMCAFNHGSNGRNELMRKVWDPTPWMVDAFDGGFRDPRSHEILRWCHDAFGEMSSPIHGRAGRWHRGSATINGWTWFGFATAAELSSFSAAWPTPSEAIAKREEASHGF